VDTIKPDIINYFPKDDKLKLWEDVALKA
jgi:hypothetical protein